MSRSASEDPTGEPFARDPLTALCRRYRARTLAHFGSARAERGETRPDGDIDLLVEFRPGVAVEMLTLSRLRRELTDLLGRPVDVVPRRGRGPLIREDIEMSAEVLYTA